MRIARFARVKNLDKKTDKTVARRSLRSQNNVHLDFTVQDRDRNALVLVKEMLIAVKNLIIFNCTIVL